MTEVVTPQHGSFFGGGGGMGGGLEDKDTQVFSPARRMKVLRKSSSISKAHFICINSVLFLSLEQVSKAERPII